MRRFISLVIIFVFSLWILPLGAFIKPSQEKIICGGQRAICLCSLHSSHGKPIGTVTTTIAQSEGVNKEAGSAGGASQYFVAANFRNIFSPGSSLYLTSISNQYFLLLCKQIEHVPKA